SLDGALLQFFSEFENVGQHRPQAGKLLLQPIQLAALRVRGPFVAPAVKLFSEHPEKIPLLGMQFDAAFDSGVNEDMGSVAHSQQGRMVFLTIRQFTVDDGGDERERGERLPVGGGIVSHEKSPLGLVKRAATATGTVSHGTSSPSLSSRTRYAYTVSVTCVS
ncbi:hypothetical protein RZS08_25890, partial [Arthrospira platensis SPKY1]|nr:hypothetical protein [Arthrospira platensis SPKY1]